MNLEKIINELTDELLIRGTYANREEITAVLNEAAEVIKKNKDATPEEIVEAFIASNVEVFEDIRRKYPTPGYASTISVDNINVKIYGGNINLLGEEMPENALFDIASMTKFYTEAVAYNLIKDGYFNLDSKISDLDNRFTNLGDLTINDVLTFTTEFRTDGRIEDSSTSDMAKDKLFNMKVVSTGKYNYNDMGLMLMKEVMENVTGETYDALVDKYLIKPLNLKDTHLIVPKKKFNLLTGSPNAKLGMVNDPKAVIFGGYSGHAGVWSSSDDMVKLLRGVRDENVVPNIKNAYTHGVNAARGIMGNTYTTHPKGLDVTFLDKTEPTDSFVIQGSTRVNATSSNDSANSILFNPGSMGVEHAKQVNEEINAKRKANGRDPITLVKSFEFNRDGELINFDLIDARQMLPIDGGIDNAIAANAKTTLKLRLLNKLLKEYEHYTKDIKITKKGR